MTGSAWIMAEVLLDRQKLKMAYHRIMFGLSFFDFISSFGFFMANWAQSPSTWPVQTSLDAVGGTIASCNISGFVIYLGSITIPLYSASLTIYYYLTICHRWREERVIKSFEYYVHALIPSTGIIIAIIPLIMGLYNPWYFYCFVTKTEAQVGGIIKITNILLSLSLLIVLSSAFAMAYSMISIIWSVMKTFRRSESNEFLSQNVKQHYCCSLLCRRNDNADLLHNNNTQHGSRRHRRLQTRGNKVRRMGLLYLIPFFITWVVPAILLFLSYASWFFNFFPNGSVAIYFYAQIYIATFLPLQGFFNWFVYMYRRYQSRKLMRDRSSSFFNSLKVIGEVLIRILNLRGTEDDEDCLLGSGMESIDFEDNQDIDCIQLVDTSPIIDDNIDQGKYSITESIIEMDLEEG